MQSVTSNAVAEMFKFKKESKSHTFTTSGLEYTGVSLTLDTGYFWIVYGSHTWSASAGDTIAISISSTAINNRAYVLAQASTIGRGCVVNYLLDLTTATSPQSIYLWTSASGTNPETLTAIGIKKP